jgi:glycosyltransferase involved in cell wall biosynthesis
MRVLMVGRSVLPFGPGVGGAELAGYYLTVSLAKLGHQVHFVTDAGDLPPLPEGVVVHDVSTRYKRAISRTYGSFSMWLLQHLVGNVLAARKARAVLREEEYRFDVIHGHGNLATLLLCLSRRRVPVVYVEHDPGPWLGEYVGALESNIRKGVFRALDVEVFRRTDHTIFVSEAGEDDAVTRWGIPRHRVSAIHNAVDLELFYPCPDGDQAERWPDLTPGYCLYAGSLAPRKHVDHLLRALVGVDIPCVIAGDGPARRDLELLTGELGLSERVSFLGSVPRTELPEVYTKAAMLVLPSRADTMPLVLLEAMACGTPPVATSIYGIPSLVRHGRNGFLVAPGDVDGLRTAIRELAADEALREELGRNARATVERDFTWMGHARQVVSVYQTLLERWSLDGEARE